MFGQRSDSGRSVTMEGVMKRCAVILVSLVSLTAVGGDEEKESAVRQEREKLRGKWRQVSVETDGKEMPFPADVLVVITIDGDKWTTKSPRGESESTVSIDPTQNPKALDHVRKGKDGKSKDFVDKSIYKLDKDTLTICHSWASRPAGKKDAPGERPKEFSTTERGTIIVYKRLEK